MTEALTIQQALAAVMADIEAVGKQDRNTQQNYNFRGVDAVVNAVGPALRKHGVIMVPTAGTPTEEKYASRSGAAMTRIVLPVTFTFHGPAGDTIDCLVYGESSDSGDKAMPKAHSVAWRVAMLQVFAIPTDDPDPDSSAHERALPGPQQDEWQQIGWKDQAEHDAAYSEAVEEAKGLTPAAQQELKGWIKDNNWGKPYGRDRIAAWMAKIDDLTPDPGYDDAPPSAPPVSEQTEMAPDA
jgi:hypothetical protein